MGRMRSPAIFQQVSADCLETVGGRCRSRPGYRQPCGWPLGHGRRDRAVERHHGVAGHPSVMQGDCGQSVSAAVGARSWMAAMAAWEAILTWPVVTASSRSPVPRAIRPRSQDDRSCAARGTTSPWASVLAGRRASMGDLSARSPVTSGLSRELAMDHRRQPVRLVRQVDPLEVAAPLLPA